MVIFFHKKWYYKKGCTIGLTGDIIWEYSLYDMGKGFKKIPEKFY